MTVIKGGQPPLRGGWGPYVLVGMALACMVASPELAVAQTNGTWNSAGVSAWNNTARWSGGIVAGGTGATASFTVGGTASLLSNITLGNLSTGGTRVQLRSGTSTVNADLTNEYIQFVTTTGTAPTINNSGRLDMFVVISGTQGFTKAGSGSIYINRPSSYTGVTTISAGDVRLGIGTGLGDSTAGNGTIVASGAIVRLDTAATSSYVASVETAEPFSIAGTGVASLGALRSQGGVNTLSGPITLTADASIGSNIGGALTLSGAISLGSNNLTLIDNGPFTVSGGIGGAGNLSYTGTGGLTLSGSSTFSGTTTVTNNGTVLSVTGYLTGPTSIGGGSVTANHLIGTGTLAGGLTVGQRNILSPGAVGTAAAESYGTLTASILEVQSATVLLGIQDSTTYDRLVMTAASGGLTLGGTASLVLDFASLLPDSSTLDLFSFAGLTGNFQSVTSTGLYAGTWTDTGGGVWMLENVGTGGLQTLSFSQATGDIAVIPEPAAIALLGGGATALGLLGLRRRRTSPKDRPAAK